MRHKNRSIGRLGCALIGVLAIGATARTAGAAKPCAELANFSTAGHRIDIRQAHEILAGADAMQFMPAHCRVDGVIDAHIGRDGKPYGIGFAVALPKDWNGRFLFQGGGGLNGSVQPPLGAQYAGDRSALARGFAVASTDSGHQGAVFDGSSSRTSRPPSIFCIGELRRSPSSRSR